MKNFLSVLYRRILYKIPLKWLLVMLALFGLLFACTKADLTEPLLLQTYTTIQNGGQYQNSNYELICIDNVNCGDKQLVFNRNYGNGVWYSNNGGEGMACGINDTIYFTTFSNCTFEIYGVNPLNYSSLQCQSEYNLIPIEEVDSSYCQSNNLCPSGGSPSDCPNVGVSNVFINDLFHPGAFNIVMNIPEEIDRDYAYTNSGNNMNIDVVGYNVDYEKMQEIIDIQNYKPSSEELSSIISSIVPLFVPGLCIILLLYFIFRFIKKIF